MFVTFRKVQLFLFCLGMMVSCGNQVKDEGAEVAERLGCQAEETVVEEQVDTPFDFNKGIFEGADVDTVMFQCYVFFSRPIPDEVKARMEGKSMKDNARIGYGDLRYLIVYHYDFEGHIQQGELVCNQVIAHDLLCVFRDLFSEAYPIYSIRLVDDFDASDEESMQANNTSCFNYRTIPGTSRLSRHAFGMAVDVNPLQNPFVIGTRIRPSTAKEYVDRTKDFPHKIDKDDYCKKVFTSYGFRWGGNWRNAKDYQHFEKR